MIRRVLLPALIVTLSIFATQSNAVCQETAVAPAKQSIDDASLQKLGKVVKQYIVQDSAVGAELLVIQKGKVLLHQSFGFSDRETEREWENDTLCNIRSMTKPITSAAAQILIDRKQLELDVPVANYLNSFDNEKSKHITVRQVLTHRSGLQLTNLLSPYQYPSLEAQVDAIGERGPQFEPGSKFWYSDIGTDVVGRLVEKVSGQPLHEFVQQEIFEPLGMTNTFYGIDSTDERFPKVASLYLRNNKKKWRRFWQPTGKAFYPFAWGSQTVYSTTTDYAKFMTMVMRDGQVDDRQILSKAAIGRMQQPVSRLTGMGSDTPYRTSFEDLEVFYGQMLASYFEIGKQKTKPVIIGHSGSDGTNAWAWPKRDLVVMYFTQSRGGPTAIRIERPIENFVIRAGEKRIPEAAPPELQPYLGTFVANFAAFDNEEFTVRVKKGKLVLDVPSQMIFELLDPDEEGKWAFARAPDRIKVTFTRNEENEVVGLKLHQGEKIFEVPKKGTQRAKELSKEKKTK